MRSAGATGHATIPASPGGIDKLRASRGIITGHPSTPHPRARLGDDHSVSSASIPADKLTLASTPSAVRQTDLDRAKGLAILLVVFGHLVARRTPADVTWYDPLRIAVYLFHMPLFMYLSGYVTFLSGAARTPAAKWPRLAKRRAARLLIPFAAFGLAVLCGKLIVARVAHVDNVPSGLWPGLRALVWDTEHSPATEIWYIASLFAFCVITPPLLALGRRGMLLLGVAAVLYLLPLPPVLYLNRIGTYFVFFVLGGLAADAGPRWLRLVDRIWPMALAALALAILPVSAGWIRFHWVEGAQGFPYKWALLIAGVLSLPAIHGLVRRGAVARVPALALLGRYVFVIYLLNTVFIGATKAVLLKFASWNGAHFLPFAAVLLLAGVCGPLFTKRYVLRHVPALDRATD